MQIKTYALTAMLAAAVLPGHAAWAACGQGKSLDLVLSGSADKQHGGTLKIEHCFISGSALDLYAAVRIPGGQLFFFTGAGSSVGFSPGVMPFSRNVPAQTGTLGTLLEMALPESLPTGTYTFYAAAVQPGADVMNSRNWLAGTLATTTITLSQKVEKPAPTSAFFYQTVNPAASIVRAGATADGVNVSTYGVDVVYAKGGMIPYGDPVFSYLNNGRWAMTAWASPDDTRGTGMLYYEGACPVVEEAEVRHLAAGTGTGTGCKSGALFSPSKSSQVFATDGGNYVFAQTNGEIYLVRLSDSSDTTRNATDLQSICMRETPATALSQLAWGEATLVISKTLATGLLLSDVGIARRKDGTWVLFVKGIATDAGCSPASQCELCARGVYRATSSDLINWSSLERVVSQASVPEAVTYPEGTVWLYYQNFSEVCQAGSEAEAQRLAQRAPISGMYEKDDTSMSSPANVKFSNESFESDTSQHYPTNGNPIALPDAAAMSALHACMGGEPQ